MLLRRVIEILTPMDCFGCGKEGFVLCSVCLESASQPHQLTGVAVGSQYEGAVQELILALKFQRLRAAVEVAATLAVRAVPAGTFDVVTSVPISAARYRERGYNQSELIARQVARELGLPYRSTLGRDTSLHQLGLTRAERLAQIRGAFYPTRQLTGERVLIVDDVVTTGATLNECRRQLLSAGAGGVWGLAVAEKA